MPDGLQKEKMVSNTWKAVRAHELLWLLGFHMIAGALNSGFPRTLLLSPEG